MQFYFKHLKKQSDLKVTLQMREERRGEREIKCKAVFEHNDTYNLPPNGILNSIIFFFFTMLIYCSLNICLYTYILKLACTATIATTYKNHLAIAVCKVKIHGMLSDSVHFGTMLLRVLLP